jgi:thiol reductant ABC exporter CydD subunit
MRPVDPRLLRLAAPARRYLALTVLLGMAVTGLVVAQAWAVADVVSATRGPGAESTGVRTALTVLLVVVLARAACAGAQEWAGHRAATSVQQHLRRAVLRHSYALGRRAGDSAAARATLLTRGLDAVEPYLARFAPQAVLACLVPLVVLVQIAWIDWLSAVVIGLTLPLIPVFMVLVGKHTRDRTSRQWRTLSVLAGHFVDVVQGLPTLKVFGRARAQADTLRKVGDDHRRATERTLRAAFLSSFVLELAATLSVAVVAVGVGLRLLDGRLDLRTALVVLILAPEAYLPVRAVGTAFHASAEGVAVLNQTFDLLAEQPAARGDERPRAHGAVVLVAAAAGVRGGGDRGSWRLPPTSLAVRAGDRVAVVGPSGSGKSTLVDLALGVAAPDAGRLLVDGTDVARLDPAGWRARVAWLPQRPVLVAGTVADNVRLGEPDADDEEVRRALHAAGASFVERLPLGPATVLGEQGAGLSAGERQRVAVARLLLRIERRDPALVLLDEPTAHLDGATETWVTTAIDAACASRTTLLVTHRPAAAAWVDRVLQLGPAVPPAALQVPA